MASARELMFLGRIVLCPMFLAGTVCLSFAAGTPELPREYVDTRYAPPNGRTIVVKAGGDFQNALHQAQLGDIITLETGATFNGPFILPRKSGAGWIVIRTSAPDTAFPPAGNRVEPSYANMMPKLESARGPVIAAAGGAHHYRFIGVEIRPKQGVFIHNLVQLGLDENSVDQLPHHIIFDRCYLHGDPKRGSRRAIALNGKSLAVVDSHLSDFKEVGADSQALMGWNGPGPIKIVNNFLEGAGENVMFGGADPLVPNLVPSDIEIKGNHFAKPFSWKLGDARYEGIPWTVKNLFELKNARRVIIDGNLFERNWAHAQNGFAILFTVRNQDGKAPWSVVEDVTFSNNIVRHATAGINIFGRDDNHPSQQTKRILIQNNLFDDVGGARWGGDDYRRGTLFQIARGTADIIIDHNTAWQTGKIIIAEGDPSSGFVYQNNVTLHNHEGVLGAGTATGIPTFKAYFPGAIVRKNVIIGGDRGRYPRDNFFPASLAKVGFIDPATGKFSFADSSPYRRAATDRKDPGVDFTKLNFLRP